MEIKDNGFVLSLQRFQETSGIVKVFSAQHGVCTGFVKNLNSKQNKNIFFPGNLIDFIWSARLSEHTGSLRAELNTAFSSILMQNYITLLSVNSIFSIISILFREREHVPDMFEHIEHYLQSLTKHGFNFKEYIEFEFFLLAKAGYSLDFSTCAVTGQGHDLIYLSPKSGKAVSSEAGEIYANKLLLLPHFITSTSNQDISKEDMINALNISTYFFERYIFAHIYNKELLKPRESFVNYIVTKVD
jgi:DNA repair protein RecO (recombination protein O)